MMMEISALALALAALWPQPRQAEYVLPVSIVLPVEVSAPAALEAPAAALRRELGALFGPNAVGTGGTLISLRLDPEVLTRLEEYAVEPTEQAISLRSHDVRGMFWAVHSLCALLSRSRATAGGFEAPIPSLRDWPDTRFRAFMIQGAWTPSAEEFKRNLELLARLHVTYCALEFGPQVVLDFDPSIARGGKLTKQEAREVVEYGRSLGVEPIAYLNMLGHLGRAYQKEPYTLHGGIDIRSDEAYEQFVYPILEEMLEVYGPVEFFHCGMDEAWELFKWLSAEGYDVTELIARHITRVNDFLKARGVKTVIWHDMLIAPGLRDELGGRVGPANGGPPQNTAGALPMIPKDVILDYWFYDPLERYVALDYLQEQGFQCWASPWQTPFSLTRYAHSRQVPVMGTLWSGPPGCFSSRIYSPVTAYYAQAVWNASAAPATVHPEPELHDAAQRATNATLWRRRSLRFPSESALLLSPDGPRRTAWPVDGVEQHFGVPLVTDSPVAIPALESISRPMDENGGAASVRLPGGAGLDLDGVNTDRGESQLILYAAPKTHTGTNIYGVEVAVSAEGRVLEVRNYGSGDSEIPAGGFVLSAHEGPRPQKARRLQSLQPGDQIAVLDAEGGWVGGVAPALLLVELPDGHAVRIDGENSNRDAGRLVRYYAGYGDGATGTNAFGVEVVVRRDTVVEVRDGQGNTAIPDDGYVLSAHAGDNSQKVEALRALKPGDVVRLLVEKGEERHDLAEVLGARRRVLPVNAGCSTLFLALNTEASSSPGTPLGEWVVAYADGATERVPVRYGREALCTTGGVLPSRTDDPVFLVEDPAVRCLVREWINPRPEQTIESITLEPALALLSAGGSIVAATAAEAR